MTATGYHFDQSPQPDHDLDTQRQIQSHAIETTLRAQYPQVSGLVVAPKHNNLSEVRERGHYRQANKAIKRERHPIPTVDELLQDMSGATKFSYKVDLKAGTHHLYPSPHLSLIVVWFATNDFRSE